MYRVLTSYGTTARSSCGRQATRALVRPVYQPIQTVGAEKIGHAGTLDPMAQGVLLVLLGHATKISGYLMAGGVKAYQGTVRLGQTTDTWDADGQITAEAPWNHVTAEAVADVIAGWVGTSEQPVPPYSAAKHQGQPSGKLSWEERNPLKNQDHRKFRVRKSSGLSFRTLPSESFAVPALTYGPSPTAWGRAWGAEPCSRN